MPLCDASPRMRYVSDPGTIAGLPTASALIMAAADEITLEQRGRHAEQVGVVVEAVGRIVRRQQRRGVDLDPQQVANRVRVLGSIQAMGRGAAGPRMLRGLAIERRLEKRHQTIARRRIGTGDPAGGIAPARSFLTTFSHMSPCAATRERSALSRITPDDTAAVLPRPLWQPEQDRRRS